MNPHLIMGIFALYVVFVSLFRLMADREFSRLTAMKKVWGRSRGLVMHFMSNVAMPLVFGILFLTRGVAGFGDSGPEGDPVFHYYALSCSASASAPSPSLAALIDGISLAYTGEVSVGGEPAAFPSRTSPPHASPAKNGLASLPWIPLLP